MSVLDEIVKAYDIRGTVPDQLHGEVAHALGVAYARFVDADRVLIARDMRQSGVELVAEFGRGVMEQGLDVVDLGLGSTDLLYFAAGSLDAPGAMFTASHNPAPKTRPKPSINIAPTRVPYPRARRWSCEGAMSGWAAVKPA